MWTHLGTIVGALPHDDIISARIELQRIVTSTRLQDLSMEMYYVRAPGALMKIIDVLGYDGDLEDIFKVVESFMSGIGLNGLHTLTTLVVEPKNTGRIAFPSLGGRNMRNGLTLP
jgi:hypothetical protein